jgi:hypothetical protein
MMEGYLLGRLWLLQLFTGSLEQIVKSEIRISKLEANSNIK